MIGGSLLKFPSTGVPRKKSTAGPGNVAVFQLCSSTTACAWVRDQV